MFSQIEFDFYSSDAIRAFDFDALDDDKVHFEEDGRNSLGFDENKFDTYAASPENNSTSEVENRREFATELNAILNMAQEKIVALKATNEADSQLAKTVSDQLHKIIAKL